MSQNHYAMPQKADKANGEQRQVGFELEFAGLSMKRVSEVLQQCFGGELDIRSQAEAELKTEELGDFVIELDWSFGKKTAKERAEQRAKEIGKAHADDPFMEWLTKLAGQLVPMEVVCPPIELTRLKRLDRAIRLLRKAGAKGTEKSLHYAFGVHINPELPDTDAETIIRYLKAYAIAQDWLLKVHKVDLIRRVTPYIDCYPKDYLRKVLGYEGNESIETVIDDYLKLNPTRNRALDMLPLFKHLDEKRVTNTLDDPRINARPTFHYRMPNCEIERPDWSLHCSWNVWCVIEALANDAEQLNTLTEQWLAHDRPLTFEKAPWHKTLNEIHQNLSSA
ncbi:hypothetical protein HMF8227_00764 [Saliniradius amylolyticus]|uniref:Amidoligase enzyme n=1 Tax=Saliniradius amylolyticus TaxID=2183582 RepID=A0A2S2E1X3_9ALTE|nr:amidoligase family protein [Saliniradius amylolyticus]AWL11260.1 hypothetical protein HMF8227_00764 [Saliniradius amylolyticus]